MENTKLVRFLLTFFLGWIGSIIINHTELKPEGYTSRTLAYIFLSMITLGIYGLVASICNLTFDPSNGQNYWLQERLKKHTSHSFDVP